MKKSKCLNIRRIPVIACAAILAVSWLTTPVKAYLTDIADDMDNKFTIALDSTSKIVEKFPDTIPDIDTSHSIASYEKAVQVINTGYIDEYVRLRLDFSDSDIEAKTQFSYDGKNFYSIKDYRNNLPEGWVYNAQDGYYYYTKILETGDWESVKNTLQYDEATGQFFYKTDQKILTTNMITVPLIRYVKTTFDSPDDMRRYSLYAYSESCPFYFGNDYSGAWNNYLN